MGLHLVWLLTVASLAGTNLWQYNRHENYVATHVDQLATCNVSLESCHVAYDQLDARQMDDQRTIRTMIEEKTRLEEDFNKSQLSLESFKRRDKVVRAKPGLIQLKANKATQKIFRDIRCTTGAYCEDRDD